MPCFACESRGDDRPAEWIVHFPVIRREYFLCDPCLTQWRGYGFGVTYEIHAFWERL